MLQAINPFLVTGLLLFLSLVAGALSEKIKVPALILFLGIGMVAGVDGPGGLNFSDANAANNVGTFALAFILFSGGFQTKWSDIKPIVTQGVVLSTLGVLLTAVVMAVPIAFLPMFSYKDAFLLGAIVSSTDAAAVFSILKTQKVGVKGAIRPLLEFESGSNDPMAVFLTITAMTWLTSPDVPLDELAVKFVVQMTAGGAMGYIMGRFACWAIQRLHVENEALYPVWGISIVMATFGITESVYGNGYLAVYVCGIVMGGGDFLYKFSLQRFHEGFAWLMQIIMFLVLGLLVTPTEVADMSVMSMGFLISFCLMFVARPVAVFVGMMFSRFNWREKLFVSWTGLRGAVPIILATYPLTAGHPQARYMFNVIFFVVLTSVMLQGKTLAWFAKFLGIDAEVREAKTWTLNFDITPASGTDETREVDLPYDAAVIGMAVKDLRFPDGVTILLINRGDKYLIPKGGTVLERDDTLLIFGDRAKLPGVVRKLSQPAENDSKDA
ncbi:MAG: potassium/proton antiporter [Synergistaceae bacterium]|nr:potassium/proton antiporter [Synergistaceae bacterium]MBR0279639.1 potassium/proton antiporter [Synergistaceae bacterium]